MARRSRPGLLIFFAAALTILPACLAASRITFVGKDIPRQYYLGHRVIYSESDTLLLNDSLLVRGEDYRYISRQRLFDLSQLRPDSTDTLVIVYHTLPSWFKESYGRSLPEIVPTGGDDAIPQERTAPTPRPGAGSDFLISGSKSFRFSTLSDGGSNFDQTLDLSLSGKLTPTVEITGAVSDRGIDPAYGTANSRLNELDRIHLELKSPVFNAAIGDIIIRDRFDPFAGRNKRLSGAGAQFQSRRVEVHATAARPKGRFTTTRFMGTDQLQGPYRIAPQAVPIVPGSEEVWLDGERLERGANKDYIMDYPAGTITFNVNHPVDSRSRVEIDYEPQSTDYRGELFSGGGAAAAEDSVLFAAVEWLREGDDREQPLAGELSETDIELIQSVGDSVNQAVRSGIRPDSLGSYDLVLDSLPDSVLQFVGSGNGEFSVTFSFVGDGNGSYRFLGNNRYQYVGEADGDYLPLRLVPAPERVDYYQARIGSRTDVAHLNFEVRQSHVDRNLFSLLDDANNAASLYRAEVQKDWERFGRKNYAHIDVRVRESEYESRHRINTADFSREFFLPADFHSDNDELLVRHSSRLTPVARIDVTSELARLRYEDEMNAWQGGIGVELRPRRDIETRVHWRGIWVDDTRYEDKREGDADTYDAALDYRITNQLSLTTSYQFDRRVNGYEQRLKGTRYSRLRSGLSFFQERINYELFVEDSLAGDWIGSLERNRLAFESSRRLGFVSYTSAFSYQWLDQFGDETNAFLGRLNLQYNNARHRLRVSANYLLSEELRRERGIAYLEVEEGEGTYVFEDGEYRPEPNGNFIRVEEALSQEARLSRGEKIFRFSKDWSLAVLQFDSRIEEELLDEGERSYLWVLPFVSDNRQPYLFFNRRYNADLRLFPIRHAHAVNLVATEDRETRQIAGVDRRKIDRRGSLTLKQVIRNTFLEESVEIFGIERDDYFSGAGDIDGYRLKLLVRQIIAGHELSLGGQYRQARSAAAEESRQLVLQAGTRIGVVNNGEFRINTELYSQSFSNLAAAPSFTLTDNRPGEKGAVWSLGFRYGVKKDLRVNVTISGQHADSRPARVTGRGEVVAGF